MSVHKQHKEAAHEMALRDVYHYGEDIVNTDIFKEAMAQTHHNKTTVGDHSASVAVIALRMCRKLNYKAFHLDERRVVLAALTHDLGIVGRHQKPPSSVEGLIISVADKWAAIKDITPSRAYSRM